MDRKIKPADSNPSEVTGQTPPAAKSSGTLFDKRFNLYDKINIKLKTMDIIIGILALLLFASFILGTMK